MFRIIEDEGKLMGVSIEGKITKEDYDNFRPVLLKKIEEHGKVNAIFIIHDLEGITPIAIYEDLKMDIKHANDFEKVAVVGDDKLKMFTTMAKPFTSADIQFFEKEDEQEAMQWIKS